LSCAIAEKSDVNEEGDSDEPAAVVFDDAGALVVDEELDDELDEEPHAANAVARMATSETAPARLMVDFRSDPIRRVMHSLCGIGPGDTSRDRASYTLAVMRSERRAARRDA
jgi:hypothetical protein